MLTAVFILALVWLASLAVAFYKRRQIGPLYQDLIALGVLGALTAGFFFQVLFLPDYWIPRGGGDLASFLYPMYSFAAENLQKGIIPLWNPYQFSGSPFAADMQSGLLYPLNLLAFFLVRPFSYQAMEGLAVIHYFLAALFMYIYMRGLGASSFGSLASGIIFAFGGFTVAHLGHLNLIASATWLPLILFFFQRAISGRSLAFGVAAGAAYGVSILAGHIQISLYTALFLTLYWVWGIIQREKTTEGKDQFTSMLLSLPITVAVALGSAAALIIPSYELTALSIRATISYAQSLEYAATPMGFITLLIPHFFGPDAANYWGIKGNLTEVYGYAGILPLLLAAAAILLYRWRPPRAWFFILIAAVSLLLAVGEHTVLYGLLYKFVPGFDRVRSAGRFLLFFDLSVAVLAGFGVHRLSHRLASRERPIYKGFLRTVGALVAGSVFLAAPFFYYSLLTSQDKDPIIFKRVATAIDSLNLTLLFLLMSFALLLLVRYQRQGRHLLPYLALGIIFVDLFSANYAYNPTADGVLGGFDHPQVIAFLNRETEPYRIDSDTGVWDVWQPSTSLANHIGDVKGMYNPMEVADYDRYWGNMGSRSTLAYDLLNAKYVVAHKDVVLDWAKFTPVLTDAPKVNVYQNLRALPRALIVAQAEALPPKKTLERLRQPDFDPQRTVLLEEGSPPLPSSEPGFSGQVRSIQYPSPNEVVIEAFSEQRAYLVLGDVYYPGWEAYLDGKPAPLLRANYIFRAVPLPPGEHTVQFVFRPRSWQVGTGISLLFWLGIVVLSGYKTWRRLAP